MSLLTPNETLRVPIEGLTFLGWTVQEITVSKIDEKWCWELWTAGFHFGGRCKYDSKEKAIEAAYHSIKHSNAEMNKLNEAEDKQ